jgi:hypothetical protein
MVPISGSGAGLLEKRVSAFSGLELVGEATEIGIWGHDASDSLLLDSDVDIHNNHGSDPSAVTMALVASVGITMTRPRTLTSNVALSDTVHVSLDGYSPHTGIETTKAAMTINIGQPVYPDSATTVSLATADISGIPVIGMPIGLALTDATANQVIIVATEGSVEQADWTTVTGSTLLTPGAIYFLDGPTAGKLTETAVTTDGYMGIRVGRALTTTKMDIEISDGVIL